MSLWHDLRSPLTGIVGPAALIAATAPDESSRGHATLIMESADKMAERINEYEADARAVATSAASRATEIDDVATTVDRHLAGLPGRSDGGAAAARWLAAQLVALAWADGRCRSVAALALGPTPPPDPIGPVDDRHLLLARAALELCGFTTGLSPSGDLVIETPR